jgi:hypothetical protein
MFWPKSCIDWDTWKKGVWKCNICASFRSCRSDLFQRLVKRQEARKQQL